MSAAPWRTLREEGGRRRWGRRERAKVREGKGGREQRDRKKKGRREGREKKRWLEGEKRRERQKRK